MPDAGATEKPFDAAAFWTALSSTLATQSLTSMAALTAAILAPVAAPALGVNRDDMGLYTAAIYLFSILSAVTGGPLVARYGPIRVCQVCLALCAGGVACLASGSVWLLLPAAAIIGIGYGPVTPSSSQLLARVTPTRLANLVFSVKQSGVPLGAVLAGVALPWAEARWGWQGAALVSTALCVAVALAIQPTRRGLDIESRAPRGGRLFPSFGAVFAPVGECWRIPDIRRLAIVSMAYSTAQVCFLYFAPLHLTGRLGFDLASAGALIAVANVAGGFGRVGWGAVADATRRPFAILIFLALTMAAGTATLALADASWPRWSLFAVGSLIGGTAIGWNGIFFAQVARLSPPGRAGAVTGGVSFFTFGGPLLAPLLFSLLLRLTQDYTVGFLLVAAATLATIPALVPLMRDRGVS
ncbi:MAG: MFS transporter [Rhodospirillales bacterium]|nr:MAG: MFS transporter [Rhodospirillales bacterium]